MTLVKAEDRKLLLSMRKFFRSLPGNDYFLSVTTGEYLKHAREGIAYAILDNNDKVCGGLLFFTSTEYHTALNYFIPESHRRTKLYYDVLKLATDYVDSTNKPILLMSKDVSTYKRFVTPIKDVPDLYKLLLPSMRF